MTDLVKAVDAMKEAFEKRCNALEAALNKRGEILTEAFNQLKDDHVPSGANSEEATRGTPEVRV